MAFCWVLLVYFSQPFFFNLFWTPKDRVCCISGLGHSTMIVWCVWILFGPWHLFLHMLIEYCKVAPTRYMHSLLLRMIICSYNKRFYSALLLRIMWCYWINIYPYFMCLYPFWVSLHYWKLLLWALSMILALWHWVICWWLSIMYQLCIRFVSELWCYLVTFHDVLNVLIWCLLSLLLCSMVGRVASCMCRTKVICIRSLGGGLNLWNRMESFVVNACDNLNNYVVGLGTQEFTKQDNNWFCGPTSYPFIHEDSKWLHSFLHDSIIYMPLVVACLSGFDCLFSLVMWFHPYVVSCWVLLYPWWLGVSFGLECGLEPLLSPSTRVVPYWFHMVEWLMPFTNGIVFIGC